MTPTTFAAGRRSKEIARRIGAPRNAVRRWVRAGRFMPYRRAPSSSRLDRHLPFVEARWQEGQRSATVLHHELGAQGFPGTASCARSAKRIACPGRTNPIMPPSPPPVTGSCAGSAPLFLDSFAFHEITSSDSLLQAVERMRVFYRGTRRTLPGDLPTGFVRHGWRSAVLRGGYLDAAAYELCLFAELRDRLRAGDVWVAGSRQYRSIEDQMIPRALFTTMRQAGPLPLAVPDDPSVYLQMRKALLGERLDQVERHADRNLLADVRISATAMRITGRPGIGRRLLSIGPATLPAMSAARRRTSAAGGAGRVTTRSATA